MNGGDEGMDSDLDWREAVKRIVRKEMLRAGVTYEDLARRLELLGERGSAASLRNKISRGRFPAAFFLKCLNALECEQIRTK